MMMMIGALVLAATLQTDACHVLTKREVAAVQGETWTAAKLTTHDDVSQCFYQLPTFTKSVSVDVIRNGREFWKEHVEEHEAEGHPPREIKGLGDEAIWAGGKVSGSLYVRKRDVVLRVSVGGPFDEKQKLERAKKLAAKALKRM